jgi:hypothetical protein
VIDKLQKSSLAILLWFALYVVAWGKVFDIVWPPQVRMSRSLNGTWPIDVPALLPLIAWVVDHSFSYITLVRENQGSPLPTRRLLAGILTSVF